MNALRWAAWIVPLGLWLAPVAAQTPSELPGVGQVKNLLGNIFGGPAASAPAAKPTAAPPTATALSATLEPSRDALNELRVDRQCVQVSERFDVWEKAAEYAGTNAQLRLQTLLASDLQHSELTESDRKLLRYLAYTTVWVPASVETAVGRAWAALSGGGDDAKAERTGRSQRKALARLAERTEALRGGIDQFPGAVSLVLDGDLRDGVFARAGGIIVVSPRFLSLMDETDSVRDVVIAHELSHLYKRHTIKELQYSLISSAAGWKIAKKLLGKAMPQAAGGGLSILTDLFSTGTLVTELFEHVRASQISYSKEQELEADACALRWLAAADIEPRTAWQVFAGVLAFSGQRGADEPSYERFHPTPEERSANIDKAMSRPEAARPKPPGKKKN